MSAYRIYYVTTAKPKTGKAAVAARWWAEEGRRQFESKPGTKSVRAYVAQLGLSDQAFPLEISQELENYAALDQWTQQAEADPPRFVAFMSNFLDYYDLGPCR